MSAVAVGGLAHPGRRVRSAVRPATVPPWRVRTHVSRHAQARGVIHRPAPSPLAASTPPSRRLSARLRSTRPLANITISLGVIKADHRQHLRLAADGEKEAQHTNTRPYSTDWVLPWECGIWRCLSRVPRNPCRHYTRLTAHVYTHTHNAARLCRPGNVQQARAHLVIANNADSSIP